MKHLLISSVILSLPMIVWGQTSATYSPLITGGGLDTSNLGAYIDSLYLLSISAAALLATIKLIIAGAKYMLSDVVTTQGEAKKEIQSSLLGLLLVVSAVLILTIINPALVTNNLTIQRVAPTDVTFNAAAQHQANASTTAASVSAGCKAIVTTTDVTDPTYEVLVQDFTDCPSQNTGSGELKRRCDAIPNAFFRANMPPNKNTCRYKKETKLKFSLGSPVEFSRTYPINCQTEFNGQVGLCGLAISACEAEPLFGKAVTNGAIVSCTVPDVIGYPKNDSIARLDCNGIGGEYKISGQKAYCLGNFDFKPYNEQ